MHQIVRQKEPEIGHHYRENRDRNRPDQHTLERQIERG